MNHSLSCIQDNNCKVKTHKLKFTDVVISSLLLDIAGQMDFAAENVEFVDSQFTADAFSKVPCMFHCTSCSFSVSLNNTTQGRVREPGQIRLTHCLQLSMYLNNCSMSQTVIKVSFLCFCIVHMQNVIFDEDFKEKNPEASVRVQQIEALAWTEQTMLQNVFVIKNVSFFNKYKSRYIFLIDIKNFNECKIRTVAEDLCECKQFKLFEIFCFFWGSNTKFHS